MRKKTSFQLSSAAGSVVRPLYGDSSFEFDASVADVLQEPSARSPGAHAVAVGPHRTSLSRLVGRYCYGQRWTLPPVSILALPPRVHD